MRSMAARGVETIPAAEGELDLRALGAALWRRKALILVPTLCVAVLTLVAVNFVSPRYKSEAKIMVEGRENVFLRPEAEKSLERAAADEQAITTQVQVIQSRDIARQVIRELKLGERSEFDPVLSGISPVGAFLSALGLSRDRLRMTPEERAMEAYYSRLIVSAVEKSRVITVEFQSGDPELSAQVVNAIVDAYLKLQQQAKQDQTRSASSYLAGEIEKLRKTVLDADAKVEEFRAKANLYIGANETSLSNQQLAELTTQLAAARAQKADLDSRSRMIRDMLKSGRGVESADIVNSDLLKRLIEQRVLLRAQLAEQSSTLLHLHPRIQELNAQINALDAQIRGELQRLVAALENDARIAGARIEGVNDSIERVKKQISSSSPQDVQLRSLEREAKAQRDLLESYLARYREAAARENLEASPAEARVISRAVASNVPAFPKKLPILLIATLATAFLAASFVLSAEILRHNTPRLPVPEQPLRVEEDIRPARRSLLARLGLRPAEKEREAAPAAEAEPAAAVAPPTGPARPQDETAAETATVATIADLVRLLCNGEGDDRRVVLAGAAHRLGTTAAAVSLARALSAEGRRVVLADLAFSGAGLAVMSVDPQAPGFAELARGTASFGDIITRDKYSGVHLVAAGAAGEEAKDLLASPRLAITLEALARAYDFLVIDSGAMPDMTPEPFVRMTPRAILVVADPDLASTKAARERLAGAGFTRVMLLRGNPATPDAQSAAA